MPRVSSRSDSKASVARSTKLPISGWSQRGVLARREVGAQLTHRRQDASRDRRLEALAFGVRGTDDPVARGGQVMGPSVELLDLGGELDLESARC